MQRIYPLKTIQEVRKIFGDKQIRHISLSFQFYRQVCEMIALVYNTTLPWCFPELYRSDLIEGFAWKAYLYIEAARNYFYYATNIQMDEMAKGI